VARETPASRATSSLVAIKNLTPLNSARVFVHFLFLFQ
jgi:hypothetical protein